MKPRPSYRHITSKSALNRVSGMAFRWSLNPYRGCVHGCHYCFARRFHSHFDLGPGEDFTGTIFVKTNAPTLLRRELSARCWRRETVALGTATDPYQPIEGKFRITRECLKAFADWRSPVGLITKGTMVIRDIDVLSDLADRTDSSVTISIPTVDPELSRRLEPGTPPPAKRLRALGALAEAGIRAGVSMAPVIPGLTDDLAAMRSVASRAAEHGAQFLWGGTLYLKDGTRDHFAAFVRDHYPGIERDLFSLYPGAYARKDVSGRINESVAVVRREQGFDEMQLARDRARPRQLELSL